jgi:hypothetical protein
MTSGVPIEMYWDSEGDCLRPTGGWLGRARKEFVAGEVYHMAHQEPRSMASHGHYFASVTEAWKNLPEILADRFPTADHLRKYALIRTGWYNSNSITAPSHEAALRLAAFIKPLDEFALVDVKEAVVTVYHAKTQSFRMGNDDFKKSKQDVLDFLASAIGVTPRQLSDNTGRAA